MFLKGPAVSVSGKLTSKVLIQFKHRTVSYFKIRVQLTNVHHIISVIR